jgi:hypothetical protein
METAAIRGREFPAHNLGMSANEKVRKRHVGKRCVGLGQPSLPILKVGGNADACRRCGHIEDLDAPTAYPVGDTQWVCVANTNLGQAHRIDGGTITRHGLNNRFPCPLAKRRIKVEGVDEYVGVQQDHGSRVSLRSFSHVIVGRRGALRMTFMHALLVIRSARSGFSNRTSTKRPSACCWMSKTSPGCPSCRTNPLFGINDRYAHGGVIPRGLSSVKVRMLVASPAGFEGCNATTNRGKSKTNSAICRL